MFLIVFVLASVASSALGESDGMFTSNTDLQGLLWTEAELVKSLHSYINEEELKIKKLKQYVSDYEAIREQAEENEEKYVGNPLNSYLLIKKLTSDWKELKELIADSPAQNFLTNVSNPVNSLKWPSEEDLNGAAVGLIRLQDTYKLNTEDLADGRLNGITYGPSLTAHDCFELGRQSYNNGDHYHTALWMNQALRKYEEESKKTVNKADVIEYLAFSAYIQGNIRRALKMTEELLELVPDHPRAQGNKVYYMKVIQDEGATVQKRGEDGLGDVDEDMTTLKPEPQSGEREYYERLCRGEDLMNESVKSKLVCRYYFGNDPWLKIGPMKEEEAFLQPRIVVYHDVISDDEIATIKSMATPRFRRATVQNYKTGELETASYRISKTAWLKREEHDHIEGIYQRVGSVTGLNMDTSEELQVSNYGIGGHYEPHYDFARREEKNAFASLGTGNRIATWLFYESDVEQGGATVFPQLGLSLWPKKGTAAFWYNLHQNGEGDDMTRHAACPVLAGSKWVSNFWIHERGQEFRRPCDKSPFV